MSLTIGDRVIVTGGYGKGEPKQGVVVAERRKYVEVEVERLGGFRPERVDFDKQTGYERTGPHDTGHYARRARTPEQYEYDNQIAAAWKTLSDAGLVRQYGTARISDVQLLAIAGILQEVTA